MMVGSNSSNTCIDMLWEPLPQPPSLRLPPSRQPSRQRQEQDEEQNAQRQKQQNQHYQYVTHDMIEETFFPLSKRLPIDTLCWVLKSKGKSKKKSNNTDDNDNMDNTGNDKTTTTTTTTNGPNELFLRARVVKDDVDEIIYNDDNEQEEENYQQRLRNRRILIRYPKGSTYNVKRCNLIPVLEPSSFLLTNDTNNDNNNERNLQNIVLVSPETPMYRRLCVIHTCYDETFIEIGCDYGLTTDRVQNSLLNIPFVIKSQQEEQEKNEAIHDDDDDDDNNNNVCCRCLGIDKSIESIDIANNRYPNCTFKTIDILTKDGMEQLIHTCQTKFISSSSSNTTSSNGSNCNSINNNRDDTTGLLIKTLPSNVVAIDINGNRPLDAVLHCITNIMSTKRYYYNMMTKCHNDDNNNNNNINKVDKQDQEKQIIRLPRLIIVKSRELYYQIKKRQQRGLQL